MSAIDHIRELFIRPDCGDARDGIVVGSRIAQVVAGLGLLLSSAMVVNHLYRICTAKTSLQSSLHGTGLMINSLNCILSHDAYQAAGNIGKIVGASFVERWASTATASHFAARILDDTWLRSAIKPLLVRALVFQNYL